MPKLVNDFETRIQQAAELIKRAEHGVVLTGAGISTPSGIPDFRSSKGLWRRYNLFEVATLSAFRYKPEAFFAWLREIAIDIEIAQPNPAHQSLASLEKTGHISTIITQNVDGLHQQAGSRNVLEVHGTLRTATCIQCFSKFQTKNFIQTFLETGNLPRCPICSGILKPDIILFEEQLPYQTYRASEKACKNADLVLVVGSSLEVMPVAGLPMFALENGSPLIIINESSTYLDIRAEVLFHADAAVILPQILNHIPS